MIPASQVAAIVISLTGSVTDIRSRRIPNWLTFPGALAGILLQWRQDSIPGLLGGIEAWFLAVAIMLGTLFLAHLLGRGGSNAPVGFGDIKLMAALGACLGVRIFLCQFLVFLVLFVGFGLIKIAVSKSKILQTLKTRVPLAPFMAGATICSILFYQPLCNLLGI